ncbi:MAG: hypothetical protein WC705_01165 [Candidatus Paceibacterota bacterium]|jgi:uncharacterized protein YxeA
MKIVITVLVLVVVVLGGALAYTLIDKQNSNSDIVDLNKFNSDQELADSDESDGAYVTYIKDAYSKDGKNYLVLDYVQYLTGADAVRRRIESGDKYCTVPNGMDKEYFINSYMDVHQNGPREILDIYYKNCEFNNGVWMYVNDNPKLRTFVVSDEAHFYPVPFLASGGYSEMCGLVTTINVNGQTEMNFSSMKNAMEKCSYLKTIPYDVTIQGGEAVQLTERYIP